MDSIVVALGGNALLDPHARQSFASENKNIDIVSAGIAKLCKRYRILITHGNGSQIGDEMMRNEHAKKFVPKLPLYILNAQTQAQIGSVIEISLRRSMNRLDLHKEVSVILTHVIVNPSDPAFGNPTKQVGPFYTKKELENELKLHKFRYIKEQNRYRRVVASPAPKAILEIGAIDSQLRNGIVIAGGGGGVPMVKKGDMLVGVDAVIDKDHTSQLLANSIKADKLVILTNADCVYSDYLGKKNPIREISAKILKRNLDRFDNGTMRPKVEACIDFVKNGGKEAYIGNIFKLESILEGYSGTMIH